MGEKKVLDLSRLFRFEVTGDSEADLDVNLVSFEMVDDQGNVDEGDDDDDDNDDDAESYSNDHVGYCGSPNFRNAQVDILEKNHDDEDLDDGMRDAGEGHDIKHHHDDDDGMREEEEMVASEVTSTANSYASRKFAGSSKRKMSEIEKSRLFWEACLTS